MNLVISNHIIVNAFGSDEYRKVGELVEFMVTYPSFTVINIVDKLEDLELSYEAFEEVELVGTRPTTIRH